MANVILFGEPMALLTADTPGKLEDICHFSRSMSGAEVNVAIGLNRLGHHAQYLTRLGDDPFGRYIEGALKSNGIGTEFITVDPVYRTGIQLKNRTTDGSDPYAPYYRKGSAASHISAAEIDALDLDGVDLVHVTGIPPALSESARAATHRLMDRAREAGIFVTFDPNLRPALWENEETMRQVLNELAGKADLVLPGIAECEVLAGTADPEKAAAFFLDKGPKAVIIKDGSDGAYLFTAEGSTKVPGYKAEKVVDTVGAGDGFAVGVISGLLEGLPMEEGVRRGNAIGCIQVMTAGDNEGLPTTEQLQAFMERRDAD